MNRTRPAIACEHGRTDVVRELLNSRKASRLLHMPAKDGLTCLHVACAFGRLDIASLLIDAGGDAIEEGSGNSDQSTDTQMCSAASQ